MNDGRPEPDLNRDEREFATRTGARLRESGDELDAATLSRLNRARQRALDELPAGRTGRAGWWMPAGAAAVAAIIVVSLWPGERPGTPSADVGPMVAGDPADFEILFEADELELFADLEFFAWLAAEELETAG